MPGSEGRATADTKVSRGGPAMLRWLRIAVRTLPLLARYSKAVTIRRLSKLLMRLKKRLSNSIKISSLPLRAFSVIRPKHCNERMIPWKSWRIDSLVKEVMPEIN